MAHQTIDLLFNVTGQSLYFDCPEGAPSSVASSTVYENTTGDDGSTVSATTGSAAVETASNTTFDADSGDGEATPEQCNLTATTGLAVGRVYLATNTLSQREWVEVTAISSGAYVLAREPLTNAYAATNTFVSTRITHAIDSTWVASSSNISSEIAPNARYRWRLVYVVSSVTYAHDVYFDLLRYPARHDVTALDVDRKFPGWVDRLPTYYREDQGKTLIDEAHREVKYDLYNELKGDQDIRNREVVNELVILRAGMLVDPSEVNERRYRDRFAQLLRFTKVPISVGTGAGAAPGTPTLIWSK